MKENNVIQIWEEKGGKPFLKFVFIGHLTEEVTRKTVEKWKSDIESKIQPGEKIDLIWNCVKMTGYESKARVIWQDTMKDLFEKTGQIYLVSTNPLFKIAAKTMTLLTKFNLKAVSSEADIEELVTV